MQVEMHCPACLSNYESDIDEVNFDRISEESPWTALGDGTTLEDELSARLEDDLECPCCGGPVDVLPTSLGRLSLQMLTQW